MKSLVSLFLLIIINISFSQDNIIISNSVGQIRVGLPITNLLTMNYIINYKIMYIEGFENLFADVIINKTNVITIEIYDPTNKISGIIIRDPYFKTIKGIKVGDNVNKIIKLISNYKVEATEEEGSKIKIFDNTFNGFYFLDVGNINIDNFIRHRTNINLIKHLKIAAIYIK